MNKKSYIKNHIITEIIKLKKSKFISKRPPIIREIPLQIWINKSPYITLMYTPGQEKELAMGFSFTEGIISESYGKNNLTWEEYNPYHHTIGLKLDEPPQSVPALSPDLSDSFNQVLPTLKKINANLQISFEILLKIEKQIRDKQKLFTLTGGTHAACVFDCEGNYLFCCEDIARHNALDKAIGHALLEGVVLYDKILCLTGRTNYTLMRKAARAQIPIVASISAPTSMSVKICKAVGITLIGFLRSEEMNIYSEPQRIKEIIQSPSLNGRG